MLRSSALNPRPRSTEPPPASPRFHVRLDSATMPDAADVWRTLVRPYVDARIESDPRQFFGEMAGTHLGDSMISRSTSAATMANRRHALDIRLGQMDHLLIQLLLAGSIRGQYGKRKVDVPPGSISLLDLGQTLDTRTDSLTTITLTVPRDRLPTSLRGRNLHGIVLPPEDGATQLLASHLQALMTHAPRLTHTAMAAHVNAALMMLCGGLSQPVPATADTQESVRDSMRRLAQRQIERHLDSDQISPEHIATAIGVSRAALYRLFERDGGVRAYIQARRLDRCFDELLLSTGSRIIIADLAYRHGFSSESVFSRAFRRRFEMSPGEVRTRAQRARASQHLDTNGTPDVTTVRAWLESIRGYPAATIQTG